ncbi:hypothetical protein [Chryseobacterium polytrichastri]|uniref:Uncharacterized protein n=1 Tax=Chryseobacterium polytrichastri TaxID=1302687 RepID=A0A1M7CU97_9FLAO|nr:hypothetical protein [Chryseobacterium polytrichastri]SHL70831.1 hypothetical protein SAMN05444267_102320 [Chryseobacterium polytrichastri]
MITTTTSPIIGALETGNANEIDITSSFILDEETYLFDYRYPHLLMGVGVANNLENGDIEKSFNDTNSKSSKTTDNRWNIFSKNDYDSNHTKIISVSVILDEEDPSLEIQDYRFISYFLLGSMEDLNYYYYIKEDKDQSDL